MNNKRSCLLPAFVIVLLSVICAYKACQWYTTFLLQRMANEYYQKVHPGANVDRRYLKGRQRKESFLPNSEKRVNMTTLSEDPYIFLYKRFLSEDECSAVIEFGEKEGLAPLGVAKNGKIEKTKWRTSDGLWLSSDIVKADSIVDKVNKRVEDTLGYRNSHEVPELKRYAENEYYTTHNDFGNPSTRIATAVLFLQNADEGGEFTFTKKVEKKDSSHFIAHSQKRMRMGDKRERINERVQEKISRLVQSSENVKQIYYSTEDEDNDNFPSFREDIEECENPEMKIKTEVGDMIVFYYFSEKDPPPYCFLGDNACINFWLLEFCFCTNSVMYDDRLMHKSCPVYKGTKYSMTYWMHSTFCNQGDALLPFGAC